VISSDHLDPGAVGRVKATVGTATINGHVLKHISVYSNDRVTPVLTVEMSLDVVPGYAMPKDTAAKAAVPKALAPK
jgi:hypothetical protein